MNKITLRAILTGVVFAAAFAALTVYCTNTKFLYLSSTQIPIMPHVLLALTVLLVNPVFRLIRVVKPFTAAEIIIVFMMGAVSSGVSLYGMSEQMLPLVGSLFYREWNNDQSEWNRYVTPFLNEKYFLASEGIREAAVKYRGAAERRHALESVADAAARCAAARAMLAEAEAALAGLQAGAGAEARLKVSLAERAVENARQFAQSAEEHWLRIGGLHGAPSLQEVEQTYAEKIGLAAQSMRSAKDELDARQAAAFDAVQVFRRGLPKGLRAYPGILPGADDDFSVYFGRLSRLVRGMRSLNRLKAAAGALRGGADAARHIEAAASELDGVCDASFFEGELNALRSEETANTEGVLKLRERLRELEFARASAGRAESDVLREKEQDAGRELEKLAVAGERINKNIERASREAENIARVAQTRSALAGLAAALRAGELAADDALVRISGLQAEYPAFDASLRRYFIGELPWRHWLKPLARWAALLALSYLVFMSLNVLVFRQWAHHEKLTYPLTEIPKSLLPPQDGSSMLPPVFRNNLFWVGVTISVCVMGWNLLCSTGALPGLKPLDLTNWWHPYVQGGRFHAWVGHMSMIFFTMIGLAFLIPKNISFSLWFFYVLYLFQILILTWAGYGVDRRSFPTDWFYVANFMTAEGMGALMVFSVVVLFKCRRYIFSIFIPSSVAALGKPERVELRAASAVFLSCSAGLVSMIWLDMGAHLGYTVFVFFTGLIITIGIMRAVAEGGFLSFQSMAGPFHFLRAFFGLNKSWTSPSLMAPVFMYYCVLFLDLKSAIAPAMANSLKLRDDFKLKRLAFHAAIALGIAAAAATAVAVTLMMAYSMGADSMNKWFYIDWPRSAFSALHAMIKDGPSASPPAAGWMIAGAGAMSALLFLRQFVFWLPHPIGLLMLVSPYIIDKYWFSIFLGWAVNRAVTRYGSKDTYQRAKGLFLGLIIGELLIVVCSLLLLLFFGIGSSIDLDRSK